MPEPLKKFNCTLTKEDQCQEASQERGEGIGDKKHPVPEATVEWHYKNIDAGPNRHHRFKARQFVAKC